MPYLEIALCIVGMSFYFKAGKLEASNGSPDHSVLWASLSLLTSVVVIWAGAGLLLWLLAQLALMVVVAMIRVAFDRDGR